MKGGGGVKGDGGKTKSSSKSSGSAAGSNTVTIWTVWHDNPTPPTPSYFPTSSCPTLDPGDVEECVTALERGT